MNLNEPNSHLSEETIERGLIAAASAFHRCKMKPQRVVEEKFGCKSLLYGEFGSMRFLVFVRMTLENEVEEGAGSLPEVLLETAAELDAEPHVIRVHMEKLEHGIVFSYHGYDEFVRHVRSFSDEWNAQLIAPKTFTDFHRMLGGKISRLELNLASEDRYERETMWLKLLVDGKEPYLGTICPGSLLRSTVESNEHQIFSCSCGIAECAGINRGVIVVRNEGLVLWKAFYARGRRIFLFREEQYRSEILEKCRSLIEFAKGGEDSDVIPYEGAINYLEKTYSEVMESLASSSLPA